MRIKHHTIDKGTCSGRIVTQLIKEEIAVLNGVSEHSVCDSPDLSSPPTTALLTSKTFGSHQDVLKLYAMSKINI